MAGPEAAPGDDVSLGADAAAPAAAPAPAWRDALVDLRRRAEPLTSRWSAGRQRRSAAMDRGRDAIQDRLDGIYATLLKAPQATLIIIILLTSWLGYRALAFEQQIEGDVEVYLPDGAESTELLLEVREDWSTDIALIYIQTSNARFGSTGDDANITDEDVLREISRIEGDDTTVGMRPDQRGIDWDKEDRGFNDGVVFVLSIASIIKEANSSDGRFNDALCLHGVASRVPIVDCAAAEAAPRGTYAIPAQDRIDTFVDQAGNALDNLVVDTNGDGIWDTAVITVGIQHDLATTGEFSEPADLLAHFEAVIDARPTRTTDMTLTGLTKVLHDISEGVYEDLKVMLPISLVLVVLTMTALHRDWRVVIICGLPIVLALAVTFGSTVVLDLTLTPMIIATGPILIGLGVDYALHLVNRIEEARRRLLDEADAAARSAIRAGLPAPEPLDPWAPLTYRTAVIEAVMTTGHAVLLSALTTIVGFSVLMIPSLTPVVPMRTVGLTLVIGITATLFGSLIIVPLLGWMLRYQRRSTPAAWRRVGRLPVTHAVPVLLVVLVLSGIGLSILQETLSQPITGSDEVPDDLESVEVLAAYSRQFQAGQTSMYIVDATERGAQNGTKGVRDLPVLDALAERQARVDGVQNTSTTSVATLLAAINVNISVLDQEIATISLWELLHHRCWVIDDAGDLECTAWLALDALPGGRPALRADLVDVALDTLSPEVRSMLLDREEDRALVYVEQPYMNLDDAGELRVEIDDLLDEPVPLEGYRHGRLTGGVPVSLDINEGVHTAQRGTTFVTLGLLLVFLIIVFRSPRLATLTMLPVAAVVLWQPILMVLLAGVLPGGVNVNVFTAMIGTIVFGVGVDYAIHIAQRIREEGETPDGVARAVEHSGLPILETTLTTIAGMGAAFFVSFPGLRNFFVLLMILIALAFAGAVLMLPATITIWNRVRNRLLGLPPWSDLEDDAGSLTTGTTLDATLLD